MLLRLLTALAGLPLLFAALWWGGGHWIVLLTLLAAGLGLREFYRMRPPESLGPAEGSSPDGAPVEPPLVSAARDTVVDSKPLLPLALGIPWAAAFVLGGWVADGTRQFWIIALAILVGGAFLSLLWLIAFYRGRQRLETAAWLIGGPVYVGLLLAHIPLLAQLGDTGEFSGYGYELGRDWLLFALLTTFATDTGAYFVGRLAGRHKMVPSLSPGKTWEGAAGGLAAAVVAALLIAGPLYRYLNLDLVWWQPVLIGAAVGIAAQGGDLLESKLKRIASVKDAGRLFPGHGGMLDRLDSLLLTIPTVYYLAALALRYGG